MPLAPVRRQVLVPCDAAAAYRWFVDDVGAWWPLGSHGVHGPAGRVAFEAADRTAHRSRHEAGQVGDRVVETGPDGRTAVWGTVTDSRAGARLALTWHPGRPAALATRVVVTFVPTDDPHATLVTLLHDGWEAHPDPEDARARYADGWPGVLDRFAAHVASTARPQDARDDPEDAGEAAGPVRDGIWLVLEHTAGPAAPSGGVFSSPDFAKHVAFLAALRDDGVLVAAGPLPDEPGAGMTVVRAGDAERASRVVAAAQHEDGSVTTGLLDVTVRPWHVVMHR